MASPLIVLENGITKSGDIPSSECISREYKMKRRDEKFQLMFAFLSVAMV
jgi:hypothetical protein